MTNQVPARGASSQFENFRLSFLNTIFAEIFCPDVDGRAQGLNRVRLTDCNQSNFFSRAMRSFSAGIYTAAHVFETGAQIGWRIYCLDHRDAIRETMGHSKLISSPVLDTGNQAASIGKRYAHCIDTVSRQHARAPLPAGLLCKGTAR